MTATNRHPTQEELLHGAIRTIEDILAPELQSAWARASAVQLAALLRYTLDRQSGDLGAEQDAELRTIFAGLAGSGVPSELPINDAANLGTAALRQLAADLLVHAQEHDDDLAFAVRARLRPALLRHVADDLAESGPLLQGFMSGSRGLSADVE